MSKLYYKLYITYILYNNINIILICHTWLLWTHPRIINIMKEKKKQKTIDNSWTHPSFHVLLIYTSNICEGIKNTSTGCERHFFSSYQVFHRIKSVLSHWFLQNSQISGYHWYHFAPTFHKIGYIWMTYTQVSSNYMSFMHWFVPFLSIHSIYNNYLYNNTVQDALYSDENEENTIFSDP